MVSKKNWLFIFFSLLALGLIFFSQVTALDDFDVWWHLKSAEVILKAGFPATDIFSATTPQASWFPFEWLGELSFYLIYALGQLNALIFFKALLAAVIWGMVLLALRKQNAVGALSYLAVILGFCLTLNSWPLRPLIFSFFFFAVFNIILAYYPKRHYLLPLVILVWANFHPSFYLGILSLTLFYGGELLELLLSHSLEQQTGGNSIPSLPKKQGKQISPLPSSERIKASGPIIRKFLLLFLACLLAALIHPRPQEILTYPLKLVTSQSFMGGISEWQRAPFLSEPLFYLALLPVFLLALWQRRQIGWSKTLPILVYGLYACTAQRHIPLFALAAVINLPLAKKEAAAAHNVFPYAAGVLVLAIALFINRTPPGKLDVKPGVFPEKAVTFLQNNQLSGPMYNAYDWGGYLIWRLYPAIKTFIDGRNSSEALFLIDRKIREAAPGFEQILDSYQINFILTNSTYLDSGRLFPLIEALYDNPRWELVYQDETALLFVRSANLNERLIARCRLDKRNIFRQVISEAQSRLALDPRLPNAYLTQGKAYSQLGDFRAARQNLLRALKLEPKLTEARDLLELIKI